MVDFHKWPPSLLKRLEALDLWPLYSHQAQTINTLRKEDNMIVPTHAASGKSLCHHLPVLEYIVTFVSLR